MHPGMPSEFDVSKNSPLAPFMAPTLAQIEASACGQFKAVLAHDPVTGLPTRTDWGESPDLVCTWPTKIVGVELTISNHWTEMRAHEIADEDPRVQGTTTWSGFRDGPTKQTKDAIREGIVQTLLGGGPWDNCEEADSAAVEKMLAAIAKKTEKLNRPHYRCFQENWLVVSEYLGGARYELTAQSIRQKICDRLPLPDYGTKNFEKIYLIYGACAVVIERDLSARNEIMRLIVDPALSNPDWEFRK
jgi:hypothetical protein